MTLMQNVSSQNWELQLLKPYASSQAMDNEKFVGFSFCKWFREPKWEDDHVRELIWSLPDLAHGSCRKGRVNRRLGFGKSSIFYHLCYPGFDLARNDGSDVSILTMRVLSIIQISCSYVFFSNHVRMYHSDFMTCHQLCAYVFGVVYCLSRQRNFLCFWIHLLRRKNCLDG